MPRFKRREADALFISFWDAYPRRVAKQEALLAWEQIRPTAELVAKMLTALDWQKVSPEWTRDGGQWIPHPASWLRAGRWEDEPFHPVQPRRPILDRRTQQLIDSSPQKEFLK